MLQTFLGPEYVWYIHVQCMNIAWHMCKPHHCIVTIVRFCLHQQLCKTVNSCFTNILALCSLLSDMASMSVAAEYKLLLCSKVICTTELSCLPIQKHWTLHDASAASEYVLSFAEPFCCAEQMCMDNNWPCGLQQSYHMEILPHKLTLTNILAKMLGVKLNHHLRYCNVCCHRVPLRCTGYGRITHI